MAKRKRKDDSPTREERARHLASMGMLATGLAHEIRSPLNSMKLNLGLLRERLEHVDTEERSFFDKRLSLVEKEMDGLQKLLTEFLSFARPPKMQLLATDINELLNQTLELVEPECEKAHVELVEKFHDDLYPVAIDQHQFGRGVMLNLLKNALEQIGEHGTIMLRTRETSEHLEVTVEDNGGGVAPGQEDDVFRPFESTKAHGTGLGLAIARRIVNEHGGELTLENNPGKGARFIIRLPKSKILPVELPTRKNGG